MTRVIATAIKSRQPFIEYQQKHIDGLEVIWDTHQNAMATFLKATKLAGKDPVLRLEDDILLC